MRVIAIDWSGATSGARRRIWLAEYRDGEVARLECGKSRDQIADHLIELAECDPDLVVGLDFAFSLPAWFLDERGLMRAGCGRWRARRPNDGYAGVSHRSGADVNKKSRRRCGTVFSYTATPSTREPAGTVALGQ